jgi:hypothetical protein
MKLNHIVAPLSSPLLDVGQKRIKLTGLFPRFPFGKVSCFHPGLDCAVAHAKPICYGLMGPSLLSQSNDLFIGSQPFFFPRFLKSRQFGRDFDRLLDGWPGPLLLLLACGDKQEDDQ